MTQSTLQYPNVVTTQIEGEGPELMRRLSILGALSLYLDFLNLFYYLLRLLGRNR